MRVPRHLGTGDNPSGLLSISCVCEGHGASTPFTVCWGRGPRLSHSSLCVCARACVSMSAWSEDGEEVMSWGKGVLYPLENEASCLPCVRYHHGFLPFPQPHNVPALYGCGWND